MERSLEIYLVAVWIVVPTSFWIRGIWRNEWKDRLAAVLINGVLMVAVGVAGDACAGLNAAGLWFFTAGLITLLLGAFRKAVPRQNLIQMCLVMVLAGVLMMLVL